MKRTRVKVCCISSHEEARLAIEYGADAIGLVGPMPSGGQGIIDGKLAHEIAKAAPPAVETFLLTSREQGNAIADHVECCGPYQSGLLLVAWMLYQFPPDQGDYLGR